MRGDACTDLARSLVTIGIELWHHMSATRAVHSIVNLARIDSLVSAFRLFHL